MHEIVDDVGGEDSFQIEAANELREHNVLIGFDCLVDRALYDDVTIQERRALLISRLSVEQPIVYLRIPFVILDRPIDYRCFDDVKWIVLFGAAQGALADFVSHTVLLSPSIH